MELYTACGPARTVARRLFELPREVVAHPRYALLLESERGAEIRIVCRESAQAATVKAWQSGPGESVSETLLAALDANDVEAALTGGRSFSIEGPALAPSTARGAFGLPLAGLRPHQRAWASVLVF